MSDTLKFGPEEDIILDLSLIDKIKDINIKDVFHALTELITNCDDAYVDLEENGQESTGLINIGIIKDCLGIPGKNFLVVSDMAGGMSGQKLREALKFSGQTSAFHSGGRSTRGLFGQGLKEACVALGTGFVITCRGGQINGAKILSTKKTASMDAVNAIQRTESGALKPVYKQKTMDRILDFLRQQIGPENAYDEFLSNWKQVNDYLESLLHSHEGTTVVVSIENRKYKIPKFETLKERLLQKPQLRHVFEDSRRHVTLSMLNYSTRGLELEHPVRLEKKPLPNLRKVVDDLLQVRGLSQKIKFELWESPVKLSPNDAGIFFRCFGRVVLDHQTWLEDLGDATYYFTGEVDVTSYLVPELQKGSYSLITLTRQGLDWNAKLNRRVKEAVTSKLREFVHRKQKELESGREPTPTEVRQRVESFVKEINAILEEMQSELDPKEPVGQDLDRDQMFIKPEYFFVKPGVPRVVSIYVPASLNPTEGEKVSIDCSNSNFNLDEESLLKRHPKYPDKFFFGSFRIFCHNLGEEGTVLAKFREHRASAKCEVREPGHRGRRDSLEPSPQRRRGVFTSIEPNPTPNPYQRFFFDEESGVLHIYTNFPRTGEYLGNNLEKAIGSRATKEGALLLAELVCDAIARVHIKERIENTRMQEEGVAVENSAYSFMRESDELKRRYLDRLHYVVMALSFEDARKEL